MRNIKNKPSRRITSLFFARILPPVFCCALLWGSALPCIKAVYADWNSRNIETGLSDIWLFAGLRFTLAGLALLLLAKNPWQEISRTPKPLLATFTATQTVGQYLLFYLALTFASGSLTSLLVSSGSFWWILLAPLIIGAPWPNKKQWIAFAIGALGITIASFSPGNLGSNPLLGTILMLLANGCGAVGLLLYTKLKPTIGPRAGTGFSLFIGGLILTLISASSLPHIPELFSPKVIALTLWLSFVSAAAFAIWNHLSTLFPIPLLASYRFLIPLFAIIESFLFIPGESPTLLFFVGAIFVLSSLIASQRASSKPAELPKSDEISHRKI